MNSSPQGGGGNNSPKSDYGSYSNELSTQEQKNNKQHDVIEPEVVGSQSSGNSYEQRSSEWSQNGSTFRSFTFKQGGSGASFGGVSNDSCLPGMITLGIALSLGIQFGLLASIGFFVFYAIGSAISFFTVMRRMVEGRPISPWVGRVLVWLISAFVTVSLAS